jgi:hypothetical protein
MGKAPQMALCSCGTRTIRQVCPHCHNSLPSQYGETSSKTIALIGSKEAGKSHYIAVLINELNNRIGKKFKASLNAMDDRTIKRYKERFRRYIYEDRVTIPPTDTSRVDKNYPLIYRLSLEARRFGLFSALQASSLVFFDTAGEDLNDIDVMSTETKYLANSDGILFLLDPLQIPAVRHQLNGVPLPGENTDPQEIIGRAADLIRQFRGRKPTDKIKTPCAVAFSKIDAVRPIFEPGSPVQRSSNHDGFLDLNDVQQVNDSMRAHLAQWVGTGFDSFLENSFENFSYFGLSALGASPDVGGRISMGAAPFRIEDPLLWILYQLNIISGRRSK